MTFATYWSSQSRHLLTVLFTENRHIFLVLWISVNFGLCPRKCADRAPLQLPGDVGCSAPAAAGPLDLHLGSRFLQAQVSVQLSSQSCTRARRGVAVAHATSCAELEAPFSALSPAGCPLQPLVPPGTVQQGLLLSESSYLGCHTPRRGCPCGRTGRRQRKAGHSPQWQNLLLVSASLKAAVFYLPSDPWVVVIACYPVSSRHQQKGGCGASCGLSRARALSLLPRWLFPGSFLRGLTQEHAGYHLCFTCALPLGLPGYSAAWSGMHSSRW